MLEKPNKEIIQKALENVFSTKEAIKSASKRTRPELIWRLSKRTEFGERQRRDFLKILDKIKNGEALSGREKILYRVFKISSFKVRDLADYIDSPTSHGNFWEDDLSLVDLSELDINSTSFSGKNLSKNLFSLSNDNPARINQDVPEIGACSYCEESNLNILFPNSTYEYNIEYSPDFTRMVTLRIEGKTIGYVKKDGNMTLLCTRTIKDKNGKNIFIKGMVYNIDAKIRNYILQLPDERDMDSPEYIDLDKFFEINSPYGNTKARTLGFRQLRFIRGNEIWSALDKFTEQMDENSK